LTRNTAIVDSITGQQLGSQSPRKVPCYCLRAEPWQAGNHNHTNIVAIVKQRQWDRGEKAALLSVGFTHLTTDADQKLL